MSLWVPTNGLSGSRTCTAGNVQFLALGPVAAGRVIERIDIGVSIVGEATPHVVVVGLCVSGSGTENLATFLAGVQLVQRSDIGVSGVPLLEFESLGGQYCRHTIHPGFVVEGGARWVLARIGDQSAASESVLLLGVRLARVSSLSVVPGQALGGGP